MTKALIASAIISMLATTASAADQSTFQVLRTGDSELSCEGLSTEINTLNADVLKLNEQAQKQAKASRTGAAVGKGVFSGLARGVSIIGYGSTSPEAFAGLLASNVAAGVAQQVASDAAAPSSATAVPGQVTLQQQRLEHLNAIYRAKPC